jgi:hypothetical protein
MRKKILISICLLMGVMFVMAQSTSPPKEWHKKKITNTVSPPLHDYPFTGKELDYGILLGGANSLTDIGNGRQQLTDLQYQATRFSGGTYVRYRFARYFGVSGTLIYGRLKGHDSLSPQNGPYQQYKQFENNLIEMAIRGEIYFARKKYKTGKIREQKNNLYLFGGVAGFYNLPSLAISFYGTPKPLSQTEGKSNNTSLYDSTTNVIYSIGFSPSNYCLAIPIGLGYNHTFHNNFRIGLDLGYRYAFTDYLDGFTSSNNSYNDSYMFANLVFGYVIKYSDNFKIKYNKRKFLKRYYW